MQEFNRVVRDTFVALATCSLLLTACGGDDDHEHGTCDPVCAEGEHCHDGTCEPHVEVCDPACAEGEHCHDGKCEPKPVEATNQCTGDDDLAKIQAGDPNGAATTCGLGCLANADPATCSMECVTTETGLSEGCAGCYVETIVCTIDNCVGECATDPLSEDCTTCQNAAGCIERFYACSGLPQSDPQSECEDQGGTWNAEDQTCTVTSTTNCDPACADGETCTDGGCVANPVACEPACADGEVCNEGTCEAAPPTCDPACADGETCTENGCLGNIAAVATAAGSFTSLLAALTAADLAGTIADEGPFTVFAPTDDAFAAALTALDVTFDDLAADKAYLTDILLYHVVSGTVPAADVVGLTSATTVQGSKITISLTGDAGSETVLLNDTVNVTATDVMASNGIIHIIDGVLLPPACDPACADGQGCIDGTCTDPASN